LQVLSQLLLLMSFLHQSSICSSTDALVSCLKNNIKTYIKILH